MITPQQLSASLGRVIQTVIAIVVLAVFSVASNQLPGVQISIGAGFRVLDVIQLAIGAVMIALLIGAVWPLATVVNYYANYSFGIYRDPNRARLSPEVRRLSTGIAMVVAVAGSWLVVNQQVAMLLATDAGRRMEWLPTVVTLSFLAGVLFVLFQMYQAVQPILSAVSDRLGTRIAASASLVCPRCNFVNPGEVRFCASCGTDLQVLRQAASLAPVTSAVITCTTCGQPNPENSKFCASCGTGLSVLLQAASVAAARAAASPPLVGSAVDTVAGPTGGTTPAATLSAAAVRPDISGEVTPLATKCLSCGEQLAADDVFCSSCGAAVKRSS